MRQEEFFKLNKRELRGSKFFSENPVFSLNKTNFPIVFFEIVGLFAEDSDDRLTLIESLSGVLSIAGRSEDGEKTSRLYFNFTAGADELSGLATNRNSADAHLEHNVSRMDAKKEADVAFGIDPVNVTASQGGYAGPVSAKFPAPKAESLVIENIEFIHERQGYMSRLFEILKRIQKKYNLGPIKMENVLSDGMIAWCEKNHLEKVMADKEINYYYYGDA